MASAPIIPSASGAETETEWDHTQYRPLEELTSGFVTPAPLTPYASDSGAETETETGTETVEVDIRLPTYVLVAERMNLSLCKNGEAAKLNVCVSTASVEGVFCIVEPCSAERKKKCKHITLELEDGPGFAEPTPSKIELANLRVLDEAAGNVSSSGPSTSPSSVLRSNRQCLRDSCYHTKVFDTQINQTRCALPLKLSSRAVSSEISGPPEISVPPKLFVPKLPGPPEPPAEVESGGHRYACQLLRDVMLDDTIQIPGEIELHRLVRFLALAHQDLRHMPEKLLGQARRWVSSFEPPDSFDDVMLWLWVMWKLQMAKEFKALSSTVQRQAQNPISRRWQDGPASSFGIEFPNTILGTYAGPIFRSAHAWLTLLTDALDQKRLDALSRIRNMMSAETERERQTYLQMVAAPRFMPTDPRMLASSLSFGYLALEGGRWLSEDDPTRSAPEFSGVSFDSARAAVRSMIDLRD